MYLLFTSYTDLNFFSFWKIKKTLPFQQAVRLYLSGKSETDDATGKYCYEVTVLTNNIISTTYTDYNHLTMMNNFPIIIKKLLKHF